MAGQTDSLPCPTCGTPVEIAPERRPVAFPFCCSRCRMRDLGAWADGRHAIPGGPLVLDPESDDLDHP